MAPAIILLQRSRSPKTSPLSVCHPTLLSSIRSKTSGNICAATNSPSPASTTTTTSLIKPAAHGTSLSKIQTALPRSPPEHGQQSITRAVGIRPLVSESRQDAADVPVAGTLHPAPEFVQSRQPVL